MSDSELPLRVSTDVELGQALLLPRCLCSRSEPGFSDSLSNSLSFYTVLNMVLVTSLSDTNF